MALNGKSSGGNDSTILTIPEGYRPPISFEQLVGSIDRSTLNSAQLSIGADGAIKWQVMDRIIPLQLLTRFRKA